MSVVEVLQNEVVIPVVPEEKKVKKTRTRKVPQVPVPEEVTEIVVKEAVPAPVEVLPLIKRKTTEAQLRSIARARESKSAKCLLKQEEQRVEGLKKHQEELACPNVPIKVVKPRGRPRKLVTVDENAVSEPKAPKEPKPPKEPKAPKEPKPPKEPKAPKPPKEPKATKPPKAPKPSASLVPRYKRIWAKRNDQSKVTSRTLAQYDTATSDDSTDTESDSSEDSHKDRKYIRKAERRLDAVKRIDERLKSHGNHYFRNNLSIF